ncbi:MAG TPA: EamA family transporter [Candidatus Acidoferrum sp.]|nr:EamA family transporter [Candidatus Acidoferrum sp.]
MGILYGLLTALSWGSADLFARFATRKIGTLRTMLYMQLTGFVLLTLAMRWLGGWGHLADGSGWRPWAWGILAGLLNASGTMALYRSFEIGKLSIVAPVSASYPVLTLLLSMLTGERLTLARFVGIALTITGVVLVARGETVPGDANKINAATQPAKKGLGVGWALLAAMAFGVMFWVLGIRVVPIVGGTPAVWIIRLTSFSFAALVILIAKSSLAPPTRKDAPWILGVGLLDTGAWVFNNLGMRLEQVSVVSVLASLYGAVTVGLAAVILREPVSRLQWVGIFSIFVGIILISH